MAAGQPNTQGVVVGVVVTYQREDVLGDSLRILTHQNRPLDHLIVVDNAPTPGVDRPVVQQLLEEAAAGAVDSIGQTLDVTYLPSQHNLGGAGGFALGMLYALSLGADWVWCADDDGRPEGPEVLGILLECAQQHQLDEVSPVVCSIDQPDLLAFPLRRGTVWRRHRSELVESDAEQLTGGKHDLLPGIASLMNGALFRASCLDTIGVPDLRLFMRGDEVELHRRLERSGLAFGTCLTTAYLHPQGSDEFKPIVGGRMHAQYPDSLAKRYYTYRNRGFLLSMPGKRRLIIQEWARFTWFFLIQQRDWAGWQEWRRLVRQGRAEHLTRL